MARQPALNEEALVKLGSEKLARLVIGEAKPAETRCAARRSSLEQSKKPDFEIVHTLTPLSLTIATASLAPTHCVAAPMSLLPRVETEVTLPAVASKYTAAPTANVTVTAFGNCHTPPSVISTGNVCSAS